MMNSCMQNSELLCELLSDKDMKLSQKEAVSMRKAESPSSVRDIKKSHVCDICNKRFTRKINLMKHVKIHQKPAIIHKCQECVSVFTLKGDLLKHVKAHHKQHTCLHCNKIFSQKCEFIKHTREKTCNLPTSHNESSLKEDFYAKTKHFKRLNIVNIWCTTTLQSNENNDLDDFFHSIQSDIFYELCYQLKVRKTFRWYLIMQVLASKNNTDIVESRYFISRTIFESTQDDLQSRVVNAIETLINKYENFSKTEWTLQKISHLEVCSASCGGMR